MIFRRFARPCDVDHVGGLTTARGWLRTVAQRRLYGRDELLGWLSSQIVIAYESLMNKGEFALFRGAIARRRVAELERGSDQCVVEFRRLDVLAHRVWGACQWRIR